MMETKKESLKGSEDGCSKKIKVYSIPPGFFVCFTFVCLYQHTTKEGNSMDILFLGCDKADCLIF